MPKDLFKTPPSTDDVRDLGGAIIGRRFWLIDALGVSHGYVTEFNDDTLNEDIVYADTAATTKTIRGVFN